MSLPREVQPGDRVRADDHNALVRAVRDLATRRGAGGIDTFGSVDGGVLGVLARQFPHLIRLAVIDAYTGPTLDANGEVAVELITYNVRLHRANHLFMTNRRPDLGNPLPDGCMVKPAQAGGPCVIFDLIDDLEGTPAPLLWVPLGPRGERFGVETCGG